MINWLKYVVTSFILSIMATVFLKQVVLILILQVGGFSVLVLIGKYAVLGYISH